MKDERGDSRSLGEDRVHNFLARSAPCDGRGSMAIQKVQRISSQTRKGRRSIRKRLYSPSR